MRPAEASGPRRCLALAALTLLAGCAARPGEPGPGGRTETLIIASGGGVTQSSTVATDRPLGYELEYSPEQVWAVLPAVFDSLSIPVGQVDANTRTLGSTAFRVRRRLGRTALQQYLDCGSSASGPNADTYEVGLTVVTRVLAREGGASSVQTQVQASARPLTHAGDWLRCSTLGVLEAKVPELARGALQR